MAMQMRSGLPLRALPLVCAAWILSGPCPSTRGGDLGSGAATNPGPGYGTLGYGGPGYYPGFQGFGLGYHKGYGYGGSALGVGAEGGYPYYAGSGYPGVTPPLRRFGPITPFRFNGGPGYPNSCYPNVFAAVGPLGVDPPVVLQADGHEQDFGSFTGALPYPESRFAPYTKDAATGAPGESNPPDASAPPLSLRLGIDEESVVDTEGVGGMKVAKVHLGSAADKAGLRGGDVIRSINGYLTTQPGNVAWIVAHAAPDNILRMSVRSAADGKIRTIIAPLSVETVVMSRPSYLPPVGNGPPPASR